MKKKLVSLMLALVMCLSLLPATASAAEADLPDWYFLFAIFKNVDADCNSSKGIVHVKYTMTQDEVDTVWNSAKQFEAYMSQVGVMRAHVDVVEIDKTLTELYIPESGSSYLTASLATPYLEEKVDLDQYDHVTCVVSLDISTTLMGITTSPYANGTGHSCINLRNPEYCLNHYNSTIPDFPPTTYLHEFMHFMERLCGKWGTSFNYHKIVEEFYPDNSSISLEKRKPCYDNVILNQIPGNEETGTGVYPIAWQYPPHVLRTITEWTVPFGVTSIGSFAFERNKVLTRVFIPSSVTSIANAAFQNCSNLTSISLPASITSIETYAFALCTGLTDIYYSGTEAQWKAIEISSVSNSALDRATIHYNHLLADVKTTDYFAEPVAWALDKGITTGTGNGNFSPNANCTTAQILTFLWRANGSPKPAGSNPFSDVKSSDFYADAAVWAYENGLVSGETLNGNAPCTRSAAVMYMWKAAGSPSAKAASFSDVSANADYAQAVAWAVEQGITTGIGNNQFGPDAACTRGQIVTFLYRCLA